jgi:hypothetical protein
VTCNSQFPTLTARAHRGPAVPDAVRTQRGPAPRRLTLGSIPDMDEQASAEERLAALHAALLAFYDEHTSASRAGGPS